MTITVPWGQKLEPHEIEEERRLQNNDARQLLAAAGQALHQAGLEVVGEETFSYACFDCPEKPRECGLCRVDAQCAGLLRKQAVRLIIIFPDREEVKP